MAFGKQAPIHIHGDASFLVGFLAADQVPAFPRFGEAEVFIGHHLGNGKAIVNFCHVIDWFLGNSDSGLHNPGKVLVTPPPGTMSRLISSCPNWPCKVLSICRQRGRVVCKRFIASTSVNSGNNLISALETKALPIPVKITILTSSSFPESFFI